MAVITEGLRRLAVSIADQAGGSYKLELREEIFVKGWPWSTTEPRCVV
ncbi:hypothetical protein NYE54_06355 [Paenibacillus sp. FSL K6-1330]